MSNTPTDAELKKLAEECGIGWGAGLGGMNDFLSAFARAVLAKWGTLQPADCTRSHPHEDMSGYCLLRTEIARLANENARLKASQPVVREPLTDERLYEAKHNAVPQLFDLARDWADNKIHSYQFANEAERIVNVVARRVEAAHGIKGGQHGTDN